MDVYDRIEWYLVRYMPCVLISLGLVVLFFVLWSMPDVVPLGSSLRLLMACLIPIAIGFPCYAIRTRRHQIEGDPYQEPFGEVVHLPHYRLKQR